MTAPIAACSTLPDTCDVDNACGDGGPVAESGVDSGDARPNRDGGNDGPIGADGTADASDGFDGCSPSAAPHDQSCVVNDGAGIFVSPTGVDGAAGTQAAPLKKIADGIVKAKAAGKRVYVCAGTFDEKLVVDAAKDGVSVYGGLSCTTWSYNGQKAIVAPTTTGYALKLDGLSTGVLFEDFEFDAIAGVAAGESSVAVFANGSQNVVFRRVAMKAGAGQPGQDANAIPDYASGAANGNPGSAVSGGPQQSVTCANGSGATTGGAGGGPVNGSGSPGTPTIAPVNPAGATGAPGDGTKSCGAGGTGQDGSYAPGGNGGAAVLTSGSLSSSGWLPSGGIAGSFGGAGQGGGGGAAKAAGGGGGGAGGCGGTGGLLGTGGGSSFSLLLLNSTVKLESATLAAGTGGRGGNGGPGQKAQVGGVTGVPGLGACQGGAGGHGGSGGGGGGGAGGLSVGIGWVGTAPTIDGASIPNAVTLTGVTVQTPAASGGTKGLGGTAAQIAPPASNPGLDGNAGKTGVSQAILPL